jgi:hypothetical protein
MSRGERVYLLFKSPNPAIGKEFFVRLTETSNGNRDTTPTVVPLVSPSVQDATATSVDDAIRARDRYRERGFDVWIETREGQRVFDANNNPRPVEETPPQPLHHTCFVPVLQGGVLRGNGYVVKRHPQDGWYIRAADVPSLVESHRHEAMETLWGSSPEDVVQKLIQVWTTQIAAPFANPLNPVLNAFQNQKLNRHEASSNTNSSARLRPGCRR